MAFRKRNVPLNNAATPRGEAVQASVITQTPLLPGTKPSYLTSHTVTSTGTAELDGLLGGHGGLIQGSNLLIGEHGTTDYSGALLRAYVAEGLLQNHQVHIVGVGKQWTHNLPGVSIDKKQTTSTTSDEKMKIAWRYENMERATPRGLPVRSSPQMDNKPAMPFCHTFDLTKRLDLSSSHKLNFVPGGSQLDPLMPILSRLTSTLASSDKQTVHRIVVPLLLSPLYYPLTAIDPAQVLRFVLGLRALLKRHAERVTAMISIPLSLYPRTSGLVRWLEHLSDGVIEMVPFPYVAGATSKEDAAQGMLKILRLPLASERGEGGAGAGNTIGDDLAFTLSRRKFVIEPFSLPPMEGDQEAQKEAGKVTAKDVEF